MEQSAKCYGDVKKGGMININSVYLGGMFHFHLREETCTNTCVQGKEKLF